MSKRQVIIVRVALVFTALTLTAWLFTRLLSNALIAAHGPDTKPDMYWYFPGDPPIFDILFDLGVLLLLLFVVPTFLARRRRRIWTRVVFWPAALGLFIGCASMLAGAIVVAHRHGSAWREVRTAIREYGARIEAAAGPERALLSRTRFEELRERFVPTPVVLQLPGWGPVKLRMAHGIPPYVGIDFDEGGHALFEPVTMRCIYSD